MRRRDISHDSSKKGLGAIIENIDGIERIEQIVKHSKSCFGRKIMVDDMYP